MSDRLVLLSAEGERFICSTKLGEVSQTIKDSDPEEEIDLGILEVDSGSLRLILNYSEHHQYLEVTPIDRIVATNDLANYVSDPWDVEFIETLDTEQLLRLIKAANKLALKSLVELISIKIATTFASKGAEDYLELVGLKVDISKKQDDWLRSEFQWAIDSAGSENPIDFLSS